MLDRFGISRKIALMLLAPIAGLVVFSALQINQNVHMVSSMARIEALTRAAVAASNLVHESQRERGLTGGLLAGGGASRIEVDQQIAKTDEAVLEFRRVVRGLAFADYDAEVQRDVEGALGKLDQLPAHRARGASSAVGVAEGIRFYAALNDVLNSTIGSVSRAGDETSTVRSLVALEALGREKEYAGLERATGNAAIVAGSIDAETHRSLLAFTGRQGAYETVFLSAAPPEAARAYREKIAGASSDELERLRSSVATMGAGQKPALSHADFWRVTTARIDALHDVEHGLQREILARTGALRSGATRALTLFGVIAIAAAAAAVGMSIAIGRKMARDLAEANLVLQGSLSQIVGFIQQHASSSAETAAAVSQTVTTTEELRRTAESAAARAAEMSRAGESNRSSAGTAVEAASRGVAAMRKIRGEVEAIAQNILDLSEKNAEVGEILESVNAIAGQSNLLAVNASIEAAKAGEYGKGFAVVAAEVKALAQQSKDATGQIRGILASVQKSSNGAMTTAEQGVKRVEEGAQLIEDLGRTIEALGGVIERTADGSAQISLTSTQQLAGIEQITAAMRNIGQATREASDGARTLDAVTGDLKNAGLRISELVEGRRSA